MGIMRSIKQWFAPKRNALPAPEEKSYGVIITSDGFMPVSAYSGDNLEEVLTTVVYTYSCITANADQAASLPCISQRRGEETEGDWVRTYNKPLLKFVASPGAGIAKTWGWRRIIEVTCLHMMMCGVSYWHKIKVGDGYKIEIWEPSKVTVNRKNGIIQSYSYGGNKFPVEDVVHISNTSPSITSNGMAPLSAVTRSMNIDLNAHSRTESNLKNRLAPGLILAYNPQQAGNVVPGYGGSGLTEKKKEAILDEAREKAQGMTKDGTAMVLPPGWNVLAAPPVNQQIEYTDVRTWSKNEILATFRTPPTVIGDYESATLQNFNTSVRVWWIAALFPMLESIYEAINKQLVEPWAGMDSRLWYDISGSIIAIELLMRKLEAASIEIKDHGVSRNNAYAHLGIDMEPTEGGSLENIAFTIAGRDVEPTEDESQ